MITASNSCYLSTVVNDHRIPRGTVGLYAFYAFTGPGIIGYFKSRDTVDFSHNLFDYMRDIGGSVGCKVGTSESKGTKGMTGFAMRTSRIRTSVTQNDPNMPYVARWHERQEAISRMFKCDAQTAFVSHALTCVERNGRSNEELERVVQDSYLTPLGLKADNVYPVKMRKVRSRENDMSMDGLKHITGITCSERMSHHNII